MTVAAEPTATLDQALEHAWRLLAVDPALAGEQAAEILKSAGNHPLALLVLGASQSACGNAALALTTLEPLAGQQPNWAMAQFELGLALDRANRNDEAAAALRRAIALKPDLPRVWLALADHLARIGDTQGADEAYASHIKFSTRDPDLLAAASALLDNRIPDAEALLRRQLKKAPTDVAALRMLAEVAARLGRDEEAELLLAHCLELAPTFHAARQNYALVLNRGNKPAQALAEIESLLAVEPDNPGYRNLKAVVLCRIGDYQPAIEIYDRILAEYPGHSRIWMSYGHALKTAGLPDRAIAAYRRSIALEPGFGEAYWSLANLKTFRFTNDEVQAMGAQLQRDGLGDEDRLHFEFALGKAMEDEAEYARAFPHYARGNALRRQMVPWGADDNSARLRRSLQLYTPEFFRERVGCGSAAPDPIFIIGMPRAGSTLIEQILSSHPAVEGTMELPEINTLIRSLWQREGASVGVPYQDIVARLDAGALRELGDGYIERTRIHRKSGAPFFIDKMPNNFAHVGLIHLVLPKARILDARRHPLACCFSAFKQQFARGQSFSYDLDDLGRYYRDYVELMAHFDAALPGRIHRVIYENMVADTEVEVRRLLDACGLPFDDRCLRFFENARPVRTASSEQVRQPIYREGVDHWRHFEPWLGPLKESLGTVLDAYPAAPRFDAMGEVGYD